jgi:hypothetical protein
LAQPTTATARIASWIIKRVPLSAGAPIGRRYHIAFETDSLIQVFDIWDFEHSFQAFATVLEPILGELGVDPGGPQVSPVRNIIEAEIGGNSPTLSG